LDGELARAVLLNVLSYISSEVHPSIGGLFNANLGEETKAFIKGNASKKLTYLESNLIGNKGFLVGNSFTVADSYLYIILTWTKNVGIDITPFPKVVAYYERIGALDNVKAAHERIATSPATTI
jgi:glutathione S-transferase